MTRLSSSAQDEAFRRARVPTLAFKEAAEWVAWSQGRPDDDPELTIEIFERGLQQFHGDIKMHAEIARLYAQTMRVTENFREREEAERKALASFSVAYQRDKKYTPNLVEAIRFHYDTGDYEGAKKIYSFAFDIWRKPDGTVALSAFHYEKLGDVYNKLDQYDLARTCYGLALQAPDLNWGQAMKEALAEKLEEMELWSRKKFNANDWPDVMRSMAQVGTASLRLAAGQVMSASAYPDDAKGIFRRAVVTPDTLQAAQRDERDEPYDAGWHPQDDGPGGYNTDGYDLE